MPPRRGPRCFCHRGRVAAAGAAWVWPGLFEASGGTDKLVCRCRLGRADSPKAHGQTSLPVPPSTVEIQCLRACGKAQSQARRWPFGLAAGDLHLANPNPGPGRPLSCELRLTNRVFAQSAILIAALRSQGHDLRSGICDLGFVPGRLFGEIEPRVLAIELHGFAVARLGRLDRIVENAKVELLSAVANPGLPLVPAGRNAFEW